MAAKRRRLTDANTARLTPAASEYTVWDTRQAGLGVRVRPSGHRSFVYLRKGEDGVRRITLGPAALMGVEEARRGCLAIESGARPDRAAAQRGPDLRGFRRGSGSVVFRAGQALDAQGRGQGRRRAPASHLRLVAAGPDHPRRRHPLVRRMQPDHAGRRQQGAEPAQPDSEPRDRLRPSPVEPGAWHQVEPPVPSSPASSRARKSAVFIMRWIAMIDMDACRARGRRTSSAFCC